MCIRDSPTIQLLEKLASFYDVSIGSLLSSDNRGEPSVEGAELLDKFESKLSPKAQELVLALTNELVSSSVGRKAI